MKRRRVEQVLREAGTQDVPAPRPEFVRDVEAQFGTTKVVTAPAPRRRAPWAVAGVAAAALLAGGVLLASNDHDDQGVTTLPTLETTTSTTAATTTAVPFAVTTSTTSVTTTTVAHVTTTIVTTTTTTTVPETTTTMAPAQQDLGIHCATNASTSTIVCEWNASTDHAFDHFRLWKHTGDGPDQELYTGTAMRFEDHELNGARKYYEVTALSSDGRVLGHSATFVTCC